MTASIIPSVNVFAEVQAGSSKTYVGDGYSIKYDVTAVYGDHSNVNVTLTNTGDEAIRNWALRYDTDGDIEDLWNGVIFESDDLTIIKNNEYNYEVLPEESISFGYTIVGSDKLPENIFLSTKHKDYEANNYTVTLNVENDWGTGFSGNISIEAIGDEAIEAWKLDLDTNFELSSVWNSTIVESNENSYTIESAYATAFIKPGDTKSFGISGTKKIDTTPEISNISLSGIAVDANAEANNISDSSESSETDSSSQADSSSKPDDPNSSSKPDESSKPENDSEIDMTDTDKDGLPDYYERMLGTDIEEPDTDHDGLTDYQEICISGTDPLVFDSVKKDVADAEADIDEDELSNIAEIGLGTNLRDDDTDDDNLKDGDEVNIYGTDPLDPDTDKDGLTDSAEVNKFGTDPLDPDSDDNGILDGDEKRLQTFTHEAENKESAVTEVSVTIEATGDLDKTMHIESIMDKDVMCSEVVGLVGEPFSIETTSQFDKATITYKVDQNKLGDTKFDDLLFLWYDRENDNFVELETTHDAENSTVSVETTHFSDYMLADSMLWYTNWDVIQKILKPEIFDKNGKPNKIIYAFSENRYSDKDPITRYKGTHARCSMEKIWGHIPDSYYSCSLRTLIIQNLYTKTGKGKTLGIAAASSSKNAMTLYTGSYAKNMDDFVRSGDFTAHHDYFYGNIDLAQFIYSTSLRMKNITGYNNIVVLVITDPYTNGKKAIEESLKANARYYFVDCCNDNDKTLQEIANNTDGGYYPFDSKKGIASLDKLVIDINTLESAFLPDSDEDGFPDIEEEKGWLYMSNGRAINRKTNPNDRDSDHDGVYDNVEMDPEWTIIPVSPNCDKYYHKMYSDPGSPDTDGDGFNDNKDNQPLITAPNIDKYMSVDNFDYDFNNSFIGEYKNTMKTEADKIYNSCEYTNEKLLDLYYKHDLALSAYVVPAQEFFIGSNAAWALSWYLSNTGIDREISELGMISFISTGSGRKHYEEELSSVADLAKNILKDGDTVVLASKVPFKSYLKDEMFQDPYQLFNNANWFCTVGESSGALIAKIKRENDMYHMEFKYIIYDYFDWDENRDYGFFDDVPVINFLSIKDSEFAEMHLAGIARSYFQSGQLCRKFDFDYNSEPYERY